MHIQFLKDDQIYKPSSVFDSNLSRLIVTNKLKPPSKAVGQTLPPYYWCCSG